MTDKSIDNSEKLPPIEAPNRWRQKLPDCYAKRMDDLKATLEALKTNAAGTWFFPVPPVGGTAAPHWSVLTWSTPQPIDDGAKYDADLVLSCGSGTRRGGEGVNKQEKR